MDLKTALITIALSAATTLGVLAIANRVPIPFVDPSATPGTSTAQAPA
jgi:hypothetical protein